MNATDVTLGLDYTETRLIAMACEELGRKNAAAADQLAADPADAARFAGAIKNMRTMAGWYAAIAAKADAACQPIYSPDAPAELELA